jgi:hypothetical protein
MEHRSRVGERITNLNKTTKILNKGTIISVKFFVLNDKKIKGLFIVELKKNKRKILALWRPRMLEKRYSGKITTKTKFRREIAFYLVSKYFNINSVPPITKRKIDRYIGSLQLFYENAHTWPPEKLYYKLANYPKQKINKLALLDYICGNVDRNSNNILFEKDKIILIDNGLSFFKTTPKRFTNSNYQLIRQFFSVKNIKMRNELTQILIKIKNSNRLKNNLDKLITKAEYSSFVSRINSAIEQLTT